MKTLLKIVGIIIIVSLIIYIIYIIENTKEPIKLTYIEDTSYLGSNIINDKQDNQAVVIDGIVYELFYNRDIGHYIYRDKQIETIKIN